MCRKVIGYQFGSPDGPNNNNINGYYIDGISLTHGSPCKHIWSFISEPFKNRHPSYCSCGTSGSNSVPSFVGTCYYCKSSNPLNTHPPQLYINDTIWDGQGVAVLRRLVVIDPIFLGFISHWGTQLTPVYNRDCWYVLDN